jgi:FtsP/CotA-like multicopper oxidase with cupredoxin domain
MYQEDGTQPPIEAPALRLAPGDRMAFGLSNRMPITPVTETHDWNPALNPRGTLPCSPQAVMQDFVTNLHFHGTNVKPECGSDEVVTTLIRPGDAAWRYNFALPLNAPPGLDWYHPHVHGLTQEQMLGGMTGAVVIESPNQMPNVVGGLRERILILRDQDLSPAPSGVRYVERPDVIDNLSLPATGRSIFDAAGRPASDAQLRLLLSGGTVVTSDPAAPGTAPMPTVVPPWKDLSVNKVEVKFTPSSTGAAGYSEPGVIRMEGATEFWRVANVSADSYMNLQVRFRVLGVPVPQILRVVSLDGVPISAPNGQLLFDDDTLVPVGTVALRPNKTVRVAHVLLPPGGRAEFIVTAPAAGQAAELVSLPYETNADSNPLRVLARIAAPVPGVLPAADRLMPRPTASAMRTRFIDTASPTPKPVPDHLMYFSQSDTEFYITEDASTARGPAPLETAFSMRAGPSIYVPNGAIQEWKIENRATEAHAFHMHQIRFRVLSRYPAPDRAAEVFDTYTLRDTVDLPAWSGTGTPPSVTVRIYFNEPDIRGNFMYHCHILEHEDKGMMGIVRVVDSTEMPVALASPAPRRTAVAAQSGPSGWLRSAWAVARSSLASLLTVGQREAAVAATPAAGFGAPRGMRLAYLTDQPQMRDRAGRPIDPQICTTPATPARSRVRMRE